MEDVTALLPSLLVGLDVNVRFHKYVCWLGLLAF